MTLKEQIIDIVNTNAEFDYIDIQENCLMIYFGDILNTYNGDYEYKYILKDVYIEIPYSLSPSSFRLHRGQVDTLETDGSVTYSGFVHYSGESFCYGACKVNDIADYIVLKGSIDYLDFKKLLLFFENYLSVSSHKTSGNHRTIEDCRIQVTTISKLEETDINGIKAKLPIEADRKSTTIISTLDYTKEPTHISFVNNKAFLFKGNIIIPKIVSYPVINTEITVNTPVYLNIRQIRSDLKKQITKKIQNENYNRTTSFYGDIVHKLINS